MMPRSDRPKNFLERDGRRDCANPTMPCHIRRVGVTLFSRTIIRTASQKILTRPFLNTAYPNISAKTLSNVRMLVSGNLQAWKNVDHFSEGHNI